jgi:hypothetical protein
MSATNHLQQLIINLVNEREMLERAASLDVHQPLPPAPERAAGADRGSMSPTRVSALWIENGAARRARTEAAIAQVSALAIGSTVIQAVQDATAAHESLVDEWQWGSSPDWEQWLRAVDRLRLFAPAVDAMIAREATAAVVQSEPEESADGDTIIYHGDRCYSIGNSDQFTVTFVEHLVLQAFVGHNFLDKELLVKRSGGRSHAPSVLKKLMTKYNGVFAPAIKLANEKSAGGYT